MSDFKNIINQIKLAYDKTVAEYRQNYDAMENLPDQIKSHPDYHKFINRDNLKNNSANPEIKTFLEPGKGDRFLDAGCCANLVNYKLYNWPCEYFGVDISPELIKAMKNFVNANKIRIGKLEVADLSKLPFPDSFFQLASVIGVLEYYTLEYIETGIAELSRVLKPGGRAVLDIPNPEHGLYEIMLIIEEYFNRPVHGIKVNRFEKILKIFFNVVRADSDDIMIKYFIENRDGV